MRDGGSGLKDFYATAPLLPRDLEAEIQYDGDA